MDNHVTSLRVRGEAILASAESRRGRLQAPSWTLPLYNWWRARTTSPLPQQENLCHFFWTPLRAVGLWIKLQLKRLPGGTNARLVYLTVILAVFSSLMLGVPTGILVGVIASWGVYGVIWAAYEYHSGRNPLHSAEAQPGERHLSWLFRPLALLITALRRLGRTAPMRWLADGENFIVAWALLMGLIVLAAVATAIWQLFVKAGVSGALMTLAMIIIPIVVIVGTFWLTRHRIQAWRTLRRERKETAFNAWYGEKLQEMYGPTLRRIYDRDVKAGRVSSDYDRWFANGLARIREDFDRQMKNGLYRNMQRGYALSDAFSPYFLVNLEQLRARNEAYSWFEQDIDAYKRAQEDQHASLKRVQFSHTLSETLWFIKAFLVAKKKGICPLIDVDDSMSHAAR